MATTFAEPVRMFCHFYACLSLPLSSRFKQQAAWKCCNIVWHNSEVPSSLLLLSVAFIMRDTMSIADKRGPQAVKIAVLETKQRRYHTELKLLQGKIRDVGLDLQRERMELEAAEEEDRLAERYAFFLIYEWTWDLLRPCLA